MALRRWYDHAIGEWAANPTCACPFCPECYGVHAQNLILPGVPVEITCERAKITLTGVQNAGTIE